MTIKEFYEWAVENGIEDYEMKNDDYDPEGYAYTPEDWVIEKSTKSVWTSWEC